ncbi:peptide deformylase [Enterococcus avium]
MVQHEIDHINGIMFYDHIMKKSVALKRWRLSYRVTANSFLRCTFSDEI